MRPPPPIQAATSEPPYITSTLAPVCGKYRQSPEDFRVDEIPAYAAEGAGDHLLVHFAKIGLDTPAAVAQLARALDSDPRQAGYAGLKDRHAVTTQWASFFKASPERALGLRLPGIQVLDAALHRHKLRTGHLRGNRFTLHVRGVPEADQPRARAVLEQLTQLGVPNYFGPQRFGRGGANLPAAYAWLVDGGPAPRGRFERKLYASVLQSGIFNHWLAGRIQEGLFTRAIAGDVMSKVESGGMFVAEDPSEAQQRMDAWEISPTGPLFGPKMRAASGAEAERESMLLTEAGVDSDALARMARWAPGGRRVMRVRPGELEVRSAPTGLQLSFTLPKGAYATAVLRELLKQPGPTPAG